MFHTCKKSKRTWRSEYNTISYCVLAGSVSGDIKPKAIFKNLQT